MEIIDSIVELRHYLDSKRAERMSIGLVPTMGALHEGHAELVKESVRSCDLTACSIFVNPTQFNNPDDLLKYPKQLEKDLELLTMVGCDVVFIPSVDEMYPDQEKTITINFGQLENLLEGAFRPGHFSGVGVVVSKLLNVVQPDLAFFGQKDLQQLAVIRKLVKDLNIQSKIVSVPTVREKSGLAMSSRNLRLSEREAVVAANLYRVIDSVKTKILAGEQVLSGLTSAKVELEKIEGIELEYLDIVNSDTMSKVEELSEALNISICIAAYVGGVRLIDNLYIKQEN
ncbi:MAG: pantoate--beta-alanine ligase [Reichenbachiella sp.]|uniref:pantoate--beta-alanine ligase n=1 Tax=Reichenbachiella sp. TaxID=2184521 RepID=UPI003296C512